MSLSLSPRVMSPGGGGGGGDMNDVGYGARAAPVLRSRIVRVRSDSDSSLPASPAVPAAGSPPLSDTDSGDLGGVQPPVANKGNGYNGRNPGDRSPPDRGVLRRSRESSIDAPPSFAAGLTTELPRARVVDRDRDGARDRERDVRMGRGRDGDEFNSSVRGRVSNRDRGFNRDTERLVNSAPARDKYRDRDSGPRPGDEFRRREPDHFWSRIDPQDKRSPVEDPMRQEFNNRVRDRDRGVNRERNGGSRAFAGEKVEMEREKWRRHNDDEVANSRRYENYANDKDMRPADRGRGRGGRGRGGGRDLPVAPPLHSLHKATVHSVRPFGMFVRIEGYRNHGLVHLSQVSEHEVTKRDDSEDAKIKALSSVAGEGEEVWIKVISVKQEEDGSTKIGCSMKYVSQGDGRDLDPNNIQLDQQQSRAPWQEPQKLKLEAVYNVQCSRCGGHGHLKKECYSSGEKTYKLLSEEEDSDLAPDISTKGQGKMPKEVSTTLQNSSLQGGVSGQLLATGSVGRGRAMVQPAWLKHGIGVGGPVDTPVVAIDQKVRPDLPDKVTTVEEALAVIAKLKEEKKKRKEERRRKKERRHGSKDEKKDKHKRRHHDEEGHKERHNSRKKHRT